MMIGVTGVAHVTSPSPEQIVDRHQENIVSVNKILESYGEDQTVTELSITVHGVDWVIEESDLPLDGSVARQQWRVKGLIGQHIIEGQDCSNISPHDYFIWMFPQFHLSSIVSWTSRNLVRKVLRETSASEVLWKVEKIAGILSNILAVP